MPISKFNSAKISGIVTCLPKNSIRIEDEVDTLYNGDFQKVERIKKSMGLNKRHVVLGNMTSSDLCQIAAKKLIAGTKINRKSIDALIFVTQTPDYFQPTNAAYLHGVLNLPKSCAAFDVNLGCSGYVYGLWLAFMMIESKSCKNILFLAGDTLSKIVNKKDSKVAPLFGDAGTATLIQKSVKKEKSFFDLYTDGKKFDTIIQPKGAFREPSFKEIKNKKIFDTSDKRNLENLFMDGGEVFNFSILTEPKAINNILKISNLTKDQIDYVIFHQANKYIITNIARRLNIPLGKTPSDTSGKFGNQSSASIPSTISDSIKKEAKSKKLKVILSGFGVGLSWATCQLEINKIYCPNIIYC
jgi:3-oxoacyl-[acyl-carrier-protein] synthase-3